MHRRQSEHLKALAWTYGRTDAIPSDPVSQSSAEDLCSPQAYCHWHNSANQPHLRVRAPAGIAATSVANRAESMLPNFAELKTPPPPDAARDPR